jgi:hypothetical protein
LCSCYHYGWPTVCLICRKDRKQWLGTHHFLDTFSHPRDFCKVLVALGSFLGKVASKIFKFLVVFDPKGLLLSGHPSMRLMWAPNVLSFVSSSSHFTCREEFLCIHSVMLRSSLAARELTSSRLHGGGFLMHTSIWLGVCRRFLCVQALFFVRFLLVLCCVDCQIILLNSGNMKWFLNLNFWDFPFFFLWVWDNVCCHACSKYGFQSGFQSGSW